MSGRFFTFTLILATSAFAQIDFERHFIDRTMRVDLYHSGVKDSELFALDRVYREGRWPGSLTNLVDTLNLGEYLLRVYDLPSGALLYSRGYCTVFNEWQTTDEALRGVRKTIPETVRFPFPKRQVQISISRRDKYSVFHEIFSSVIDPADPVQVATEKRHPDMEIMTLMDHGDIHRKVDILIVGDGYATKDMEKFKSDARHFNDVMFATKPFSERSKDFNVRALCAVSAESGIDKPDADIWKNTALGCMYNTFGSERYVLTEANRELRDIVSAAPYDFICILINDDRYGGGGIYQLYTTTYTIDKNPANSWQRDYVYVHEFGHSFGGLGDEYYSSSTGYVEFYPAGVEPWEPNVTRMLNGRGLKWKALVSPGLSIPTDWGKAAYDSLSALLYSLDRQSVDYVKRREQIRKALDEIISNPALIGKVGSFEGSGYTSEGMYRPSLNCRMFSLSLTDFDPVCREAIERQIDFYTR